MNSVHTKKVIAFCVAVAFIFISLGTVSMSIKDYGKVCLFSSISGVITQNGQPVANARVKRVVGKAHVQGELTDETTTDEKGYFEMPAVFERNIIAKVLPMEFAVPQQIFVYVNSSEYEIWKGVKRKREENTESKGAPLVVRCDINNERKLKQIDGNMIFSACEWNAEEDAPFEIMPPEEDDE